MNVEMTNYPSGMGVLSLGQIPEAQDGLLGDPHFTGGERGSGEGGDGAGPVVTCLQCDAAVFEFVTATSYSQRAWGSLAVILFPQPLPCSSQHCVTHGS